MQRELDHDWLDWAPTEHVLEARHGPITCSRIGVIAKEKQGRLKLRLIHDLRRSGVNAKVAFEERVTLPRLDDATRMHYRSSRMWVWMHGRPAL